MQLFFSSWNIYAIEQKRHRLFIPRRQIRTGTQVVISIRISATWVLVVAFEAVPSSEIVGKEQDLI